MWSRVFCVPFAHQAKFDEEINYTKWLTVKMFAKATYIARRAALISRMGCGGVVVIPGNELSPNSYLNNPYYFRQDATFRYFFGSDRPSLWGVIDLDSGEQMLFGEESSLDDLIWTGAQPSIAELGAEVGISICKSVSELMGYIAEAERHNRTIHILPPYRGETKIALAELLNSPIDSLLSGELIFAVAELREKKSEEEIAALEEAYKIGYELHTTAMRMCRPGVVEREIGGALEGIARQMGAGVSFPPICTQHGETLHNTEREGVLRSGRLMLCDAGGESLEGYCSDHTRTYPISGKFTDIQRDIYNVVLRAKSRVAEIARPKMLYSDLQRATYLSLAEGLKELDFMRGSAEDILQSGAISMLMPHGVSHGLGLDVHDCEALGERTFDLSRFTKQVERSTSCIIRSRWIFDEGTVISNEPGLYFIPALIEKRRSEGLYRGIANFDKIAKYLDFGGIRIEDDLVITDSGSREIGDVKIPITTSEIEDYMARQ
ncbi:MAG: aminopeptidase P family protein [Rikenellaceae bacterium]